MVRLRLIGITLATEELASLVPELAIRLVLRLCTSDTDDTLRRVVSRTSVATLTEDSAISLASICMDAIDFAQPRLFTLDETKAGISSIERMRVAIEVLSRLVPRLEPEMVNAALDKALECYRTPRIAQNDWLTEPVGNLLERSWEALPPEHRSIRVFDLLAAPIVGMDGFEVGRGFRDPISFVGNEDLSAWITSDSDDQYREVVDFLSRTLRSNNGRARGRAMSRLLYLAGLDILTEDDKQEFANILWSDSDPVLIPISRNRTINHSM